MKLMQEIKGDVFVLRLSGQLMGGTDADAVRDRVGAALKQGFKKLLFDLNEVTWVNSTGLGILISAHITASNQGGRIRLMRVSRRIDSIFAITRLSTVFATDPDEESALQAFAS
jgi:anti-sigma B factor antagonist